MAWCLQATGDCLSQCWPRSMSPNGVTRPQWVKWVVSDVAVNTLCDFEDLYACGYHNLGPILKWKQKNAAEVIDELGPIADSSGSVLGKLFNTNHKCTQMWNSYFASFRDVDFLLYTFLDAVPLLHIIETLITVSILACVTNNRCLHMMV